MARTAVKRELPRQHALSSKRRVSTCQAAIDAFKVKALAQAEGMLPQFNGVISAPGSDY